LRGAGVLVMVTLLLDRLTGSIDACLITAKRVPPRRVVLASIAITASITKNGPATPMKISVLVV
jgi:hypothetical protein